LRLYINIVPTKERKTVLKLPSGKITMNLVESLWVVYKRLYYSFLKYAKNVISV